MRYGDLMPGDMFNTITYRYVKQLDGSAMHATGKYAGQQVTFNDDDEIVPLYVASEQASLRSIIEAADSLSVAVWKLPEAYLVQDKIEHLDALVDSAKRSLRYH